MGFDRIASSFATFPGFFSSSAGPATTGVVPAVASRTLSVDPSSPLTPRPGLGLAAPSSHDGPCPGVGTRHIGEWPVPAQVPEPVPAEGDIRAEPGGWLLRMPSERVHGSATVVRAVAAMRWRAPVFPRIGRTGQGPQVHRQESLPSQDAQVYKRRLLGQPVLL